MVFKSAQALVASESTVTVILTWTPPLVAREEEEEGEGEPAAVAEEETTVEGGEGEEAHREVLRQIDLEDKGGVGQ